MTCPIRVDAFGRSHETLTLFLVDQLQAMRAAIQHWRRLVASSRATQPATSNDKALSPASVREQELELAEKERQLLILADRVRRLELELMPHTLCPVASASALRHAVPLHGPASREPSPPATREVPAPLFGLHEEHQQHQLASQAYGALARRQTLPTSSSSSAHVHVSKATREYAQVSPFVVRGTPAKDAMAQCSVYSCGPGMVADSPMERTVAPHTSWSLSPSGISSHATEVCPDPTTLVACCAAAPRRHDERRTDAGMDRHARACA
jgi:hypothetical protein